MQCNKVNFGSKIIFADAKTFDKVKRGYFIPWNPCAEYIQKADEFYTERVRTCAAGLLMNTKTKTVLGFHIYDCLENLKDIPYLIKNMTNLCENPDKCLLLGGKRLFGSPYSMDIFGKFQEIFEKNIEKITFFEEHTYPWSETNICYSIKDDTCYISSMFRDNKDFKEKYISSKEELEKCFKKIKISSDDELIFHS